MTTDKWIMTIVFTILLILDILFMIRITKVEYCKENNIPMDTIKFEPFKHR